MPSTKSTLGDLVSFYDSVLAPAMGEALPWVVLFGVPALIYKFAHRRHDRDFPNKW